MGLSPLLNFMVQATIRDQSKLKKCSLKLFLWSSPTQEQIIRMRQDNREIFNGLHFYEKNLKFTTELNSLSQLFFNYLYSLNVFWTFPSNEQN